MYGGARTTLPGASTLKIAMTWSSPLCSSHAASREYWRCSPHVMQPPVARCVARPSPSSLPWRSNSSSGTCSSTSTRTGNATVTWAWAVPARSCDTSSSSTTSPSGNTSSVPSASTCLRRASWISTSRITTRSLSATSVGSSVQTVTPWRCTPRITKATHALIQTAVRHSWDQRVTGVIRGCAKLISEERHLENKTVCGALRDTCSAFSGNGSYSQESNHTEALMVKCQLWLDCGTKALSPSNWSA